MLVNRIYLAEHLLHLRSCSFVLTKHAPIITVRWVVEVGLHLVVPLLVHNQHQRLRFVRFTVEVMSQNWTQATVIVVSLNNMNKKMTYVNTSTSMGKQLMYVCDCV